MKSLRSKILAFLAALALLAPSAALAQQGFTLPNNTVMMGHMIAVPNLGAPPVLSACGTTPTLGPGSTDTDGQVTMGTTATGCVITFAVPYLTSPFCTVTWQATPLASQSYTLAATAITTVQTSTTGNILNYHCVARTGG